MPKVIVIGGGPAGSMAALLLVRAGFCVDLLEQHSFPRNKVCGECLSGVGIDALNRAGVLSEFEAEKPAKLIRSLLHPMDGPSIEIFLPRASMGISRIRMDQLLLEAAAREGVCLHQPARCESILKEPSRVGPEHSDRGDTHDTPWLCWRDLQSNTLHETSADWIVVADGKRALLPSQAKPTKDLGIKTHFANVNGPRNAIELFAGRGNYGGIAAIEGKRWNAAFSVPALLVRQHCGDLQSVFDQLTAENPMLYQRISTAKRIGPWLASPLPRFAVSNDWPHRVVPIGNAAAALEPVGGEGMGLALRSAELAAQAIIATKQTGDDRLMKNLPAEFNKLWKIRRTICRGIAMMFSNEYVADAVAPLMAANMNIPAAFMRLAGKAQS